MDHHDWLNMPALLDKEDPGMPALLDEAWQALPEEEDSWPEAQSVVYHSYPQDPVGNLARSLVNTLISDPEIHVPRFDWETFTPFYSELEKAAQASPSDFVPFDVEMEQLIKELAPNEQARDKLLMELLFPN
jgi:hypothetical protein